MLMVRVSIRLTDVLKVRRSSGRSEHRRNMESFVPADWLRGWRSPLKHRAIVACGARKSTIVGIEIQRLWLAKSGCTIYHPLFSIHLKYSRYSTKKSQGLEFMTSSRARRCVHDKLLAFLSKNLRCCVQCHRCPDLTFTPC